MSVFTLLSSSQIQALLAPHELTLVSFEAASEGIENSNFFVAATDHQGQSRKYVLTILETQDAVIATWVHDLLVQLAHEGLNVPLPMGELQSFDGKPVLLAPCLAGRHIERPNAAQAAAMGELLARLHQSSFRDPSPMEDERERLQQLNRFSALLPAEWSAIAQQLLDAWETTANPDDYCLIHGDFFRDNSLFDGDKLEGVLDFYHACYDLPVYDIAVALNDWALDQAGVESPEISRALLEGYQRIAPLPTPELLPQALAVGALRFWLSRLEAQQKATNSHAGRGSKPPAEFAAKLALRWQQLQG